MSIGAGATAGKSLTPCQVQGTGGQCWVVVNEHQHSWWLTEEVRGNMQRIFLAVRAFFRILGSAAVAQQVDSVLRGAAVATVSAQVLGFLISIIYLRSRHSGYQIKLSDLKLRLPILRDIAVVGVPSFINGCIKSPWTYAPPSVTASRAAITSPRLALFSR